MNIQNYVVTVNKDVMNPIIDWTKYVDAIYCIHYLPYKERKSTCDMELGYMDILHSPIFKYFWTYQEKYEDIIVDYMHPTYEDFHNERRSMSISLTHAYYRIFRESQELGYRSILVIEDDIRFDHRKQYMLETLEHLPDDWDFVTFDKILNQRENHRLATIVPGPYFGGNYTGGFWGTVFGMWSAKAMNVAVNVLESELWPIDYILVNRDDERLLSLKRYVTTKTMTYQDGQMLRYQHILY